MAPTFQESTPLIQENRNTFLEARYQAQLTPDYSYDIPSFRDYPELQESEIALKEAGQNYTRAH